MKMMLTIFFTVVSALVSGIVAYGFGRVAHFEDLTMKYRDELMAHLMTFRRKYEKDYRFNPGCPEACSEAQTILPLMNKFLRTWSNLFRRGKCRELNLMSDAIVSAVNGSSKIMNCNQSAAERIAAAQDIATKLDGMILFLSKL